MEKQVKKEINIENNQRLNDLDELMKAISVQLNRYQEKETNIPLKYGDKMSV